MNVLLCGGENEPRETLIFFILFFFVLHSTQSISHNPQCNVLNVCLGTNRKRNTPSLVRVVEVIGVVINLAKAAEALATEKDIKWTAPNPK